ncbi:MAG: DUF3037 domain-containing protein [Bacteroides sp.]|nr:DUF3037 domain-containing protein [Bacteroides sp.]
MSENDHLYEYAVIRFVPSVERQEFINVGVIMMCKRQRWIKVCVSVPREKFEAFHPSIEFEVLNCQLDSLRQLAEASNDAGPIAKLPVEERFRWLTAVRSACVQTSRPHPGITSDLDAEFEIIFKEQVG